MLRSAGRWLLAAKTAVKEPTKVRAVVKKSKVKKEKKVIDTSKFYHNVWQGNTLLQLVNALPKPAQPEFEHHDTWLHKNGFGLKFYREHWSRYPEPSYWTIAKFKPRSKKEHPKVWGIRTWRGVTEPLPREIPATSKRDWRILLEPGTRLGPSVDQYWEAPPIDASSDPAASTQLPEGLPGTKEGTWPYPWGPGGRNFNKKKEAEETSGEEASASDAAQASQ